VRPGQANRAPLPSTPTPASRMTPGGRPLPAGARGLAPALPGQALPGQMMSPQQFQMVQQANQMHAQPLLPTPTKKWYGEYCHPFRYSIHMLTPRCVFR